MLSLLAASIVLTFGQVDPAVQGAPEAPKVQSAPVGADKADLENLSQLMTEIATSARNTRLTAAYNSGGAGLAVAALGGFILADSRLVYGDRTASIILVATGAGFTLGSIIRGVRRTEIERVAERFSEKLAEGPQAEAEAVARARVALSSALIEYDRLRSNVRTGGIIMGILGAAAVVGGEVFGADAARRGDFDFRPYTRGLGTAYVILGTTTFLSAKYLDDPAERLVRHWLRDAEKISIPNVAFMPLENGGGLVLSGRF